MPKIFVLRNRLQEQQARLLETQKGQQIKIRSDELDGGPEQDQPVALIVDKKSDINATANKDNYVEHQPGKIIITKPKNPT